jgi:hypothetical protein
MDDRRVQALMEAISSTEPSTFREFLGSLRDDSPDDKREWWELFRDLETLESELFVEIERLKGGKIDTLILTEAGVARLRELRER